MLLIASNAYCTRQPPFCGLDVRHAKSGQDGDEPISVRETAAAPTKKGSKARTAAAEVLVKDEWLAEHASQVMPMLPGGAYTGTASVAFFQEKDISCQHSSTAESL